MAEVLLLDSDTVRNYFRHYQNQTGLSGSEQQQLKAHLDDNLCLSTHIAYVKAQWNVRYSERGMNHHHFGYVYKKPQLVPGKANRQAQKEFLVEYKA